MKRVVVAPQVARFIHQLAPVPRRKLRLALAALAHERGDIKELAPPLRCVSLARARAKQGDCSRCSAKNILAATASNATSTGTS